MIYIKSKKKNRHNKIFEMKQTKTELKTFRYLAQKVQAIDSISSIA